MSKPITIVAMVAVAAASAAGCASVRQAVGAEKVRPDEFRVVTRAPLVLPPDYGLRPPQPGDPRPQERSASDEARNALFGQDIGVNTSVGERQLVANAGAETAPVDIRDTIDFEAAGIVHRTNEVADGVIEFQGSAAGQQSVEEQERVRRVTGGAPVVIQRSDAGRVKLPGT